MKSLFKDFCNCFIFVVYEYSYALQGITFLGILSLLFSFFLRHEYSKDAPAILLIGLISFATLVLISVIKDGISEEDVEEIIFSSDEK